MTHQLRNLSDDGFKVELFEHGGLGGANFLRFEVPGTHGRPGDKRQAGPRVEWCGSRDGQTFSRVDDQDDLDDLNADYAAYLEARKEQAQ